MNELYNFKNTHTHNNPPPKLLQGELVLCDVLYLRFPIDYAEQTFWWREVQGGEVFRII